MRLRQLLFTIASFLAIVIMCIVELLTKVRMIGFRRGWQWKSYLLASAIWGMEILAREGVVFKASFIPIPSWAVPFFFPLSLSFIALANAIAADIGLSRMRESIREGIKFYRALLMKHQATTRRFWSAFHPLFGIALVIIALAFSYTIEEVIWEILIAVYISFTIALFYAGVHPLVERSLVRSFGKKINLDEISLGGGGKEGREESNKVISLKIQERGRKSFNL